jgi:hypothetical protein
LLPFLVLFAVASWFVVSGMGSQPAAAAVTNQGFETGNLSGWSQGTVTETITVVGSDTIAAGVVATPLEGNYMARLGKAEPTADEYQPMGPNELYQNFTITENVLRFAYNIWTYDYTGYDEFRWEVRLTDTDTVIGTFQTKAWGTDGDTSRKTSGWQVVSIDTSGYQGRPARLFFSARGTEDQLYAFWVYIDSAEQALAPGVIDYSGIKVNGFSPSRNPQTQTIFLTRPPSTGTNTISVPIVCPDGSDPISADLIVSGPGDYLQTYAMTKDGDAIWEVTFPTPPGDPGDTFTLTLRINCAGTIITVTIGSLTLVDPSGYVTDAVTSAAIPEATVTLQRLDGSTWADVNPYETAGDPPSPTINPQVNPQLTDADGHYGWDVVAGTYRVVVEKEGYVTQTGSSVTVPPPVTDLNIQLVPSAGATRTLQWGSGWHNAVWTGAASAPEEAFACAEGKYAAAYRYVDGGLERYFPGQAGISNMTDLAQYDTFLILITDSVTCEMPIEAAPGTTRTLQWAAGWQDAGWTGASGTPPQNAFACAEGKYAAAYKYLDEGGLERYFPGQSGISNMGVLSQHDAFLILITAPVSCDMAIATSTPGPAPTAAASPTPMPSPTPTATPTAEDFELVEATTAQDVDESSGEPVGETDDFDEEDPYVYAWLYFEHITVPELCLRASWYLPDDSLYNTNEYCEDRPAPGEWWGVFWFFHEIADTDWADIHGTYTVDLSVDSGGGFEYLTSLHFTIS